ncbi:glycosyltransferase family 4 protein, partial [Salmonella sp. SAL4435]|uniref:glycosyltransferase family 4 protein n=1 Tax=Salmonella sp. SAL4435 TaxID=3159890 RepID=UPI003977EF14
GRLFGEVPLPPSSFLVLKKNPRIRLPLLKIDDAALLGIRRFVKEREIDILHAHNLAPLIYAGLATKLMARRPTLVYT